jgi:Short C-terminal domain
MKNAVKFLCVSGKTVEMSENDITITPTTVQKWLHGLPFVRFRYTDISSIESTDIMIRFVLSGAGKKANKLNITDANRDPYLIIIRKAELTRNIIDDIYNRMNQVKQPQAPVATQESLLKQLQELSEMKDKGILTQEEFEKAKSKLLV